MTDRPSIKRPSFRPVQPATSAETPEALFYKLSREGTHDFLRGPQQDVLREYAPKHVGAPNVALELPTGTGKTTVGLLVAEWKRAAGGRVAYLSLTNQLAGQVLLEAKRLGVPVADLRGAKADRDPAAVGRFKAKDAVGVTTYSNLFNVNPVVQDCDLLVFDDAHGGERYVSDMWTVSVHRRSDRDLYDSLLADLRPGLNESQLQAILDPSGSVHVELVDVVGHPSCMSSASATLDAATSDSVKYAFRLLRTKLHACLFLVSASEITIRPTVPPTYTHAPFAGAKQRIYMSATLGGQSDLRRAYGVGALSMIRAQNPQWGRRYMFVPGAYSSDDRALEVVASLWSNMSPRRGVLLAPSERTMTKTYEGLGAKMSPTPRQVGATDIADSLDAFTGVDGAVLTLAGRYDGLDLPDDQCRLLVMSESPAAIDPLERHLSERWKLGPILRKRERTRLIQGMGRCTRNPRDFAIIVWLGQSLVNAATSSSLIGGMPADLAAEITWGLKQSIAAADKPDELLGMMLGLLEDAEYRKSADEEIRALAAAPAKAEPEQYEKLGEHEVKYAHAMWDEDFDRAIEAAREIADNANDVDLSGYRAWWWYLLSVAAARKGDRAVEAESLRRSAHCGVNSGWVKRVLRERGTPEDPKAGDIEPNAQGVWDLLEDWGWAGPRFAQHIQKMKDQLRVRDHKVFHEGLDRLGRCLGAQTTRLTEQGAPDVVWSFASDVHAAFEAKTEKEHDGALSKGDLLETKGHRDWVRARICGGRDANRIETVAISAAPTVHKIGEPFAENVFHMTPEAVAKWADEVADALSGLRVRYTGQEFASAKVEFAAALRTSGMTTDIIFKTLTTTPLKK